MEVGLFGQYLAKLKGFVETYEFFIKTPLTMFVVLTPLAVIPIFLGMTPDAEPADRIKIVRTTCWVAGFILVFFAFTGQMIFNFLGVDIPAFMIAAGALLFYVGFDMLRAKESDAKISQDERRQATSIHDIAITPLAIPLLAGPATISYIILLQSESNSSAETITVYGSIIVNMIITYWILRLCAKGAKWLNPFVLKLIRRLTGLILASMAVQIILIALVKLNIISDFTKVF